MLIGLIWLLGVFNSFISTTIKKKSAKDRKMLTCDVKKNLTLSSTKAKTVNVSATKYI